MDYLQVLLGQWMPSAVLLKQPLGAALSTALTRFLTDEQ